MDINWLLFAIVIFAFIFKINRLEKRIKILEQNGSYPNKEELGKMKIGGTDQ